MSEPIKKLRQYFSRIEHLIDEDQLADAERFLNEPIEVSVVIARCTCGWLNSFPSHKEAPESCPSCSSNLVIRSQTGQDEIVYPVVNTN